jgi:hypothetical protein
MPPSAPFYTDWPFWSAVMAAVAIALSQLPPVRFWFKRAALRLEVHHRMNIQHKVGNPNLALHLLLANEGGRNVRIAKVTAALARDGKHVWEMDALNYTDVKTPAHGRILWSPITLKPNDDWGNFLEFFNPFDRTTDKAYRTAEAALKEYIVTTLRKRREAAELTGMPEPKDVIKAPLEYVRAFNTIFDKLFIWEPGEYTVTFTVHTTPLRATTKSNFRFTLYESDTEELKKQRDDWPTGGGIYFEVANHTGVFVPVSK